MQILITLWFALLPLFSVTEEAPAPVNRVIAARDYCKIYGAVYLERDPKYKNTAAHTVYLNEEEAFANMVVYRENNKLFADATAVWYLTPNKAFADHIVYVTDNRNFADFTVHFTNVRSFAACRE
ncbi:hypothetical protein ABID22_002695 [Pontibacter aydingkolensis]|uniref:7(1) septoil knot domain-containing protein n=1 Tax=Pontibacter aydingkolensis TaxID=1911536 RepID=A0ABS7CX38_9BACT|nr:DUF6150 family protein [Pontibacter aydingkolensis]MBW7468343.1 hypothetical protein [Pontibacter aydingkolensis]